MNEYWCRTECNIPCLFVLSEKYPNLVEFCERMKSAFWPEWDDRILHRTDKSTAESSSADIDGPARFHQISTADQNGPVACSMGTTTASRRITSLLPGRTTPARDGFVTRPNSLLTRSQVIENIMKTHDKGKSVPTMFNAQRSQLENKNIAKRASQVTASSILAQKPTLCLQQHYYHDLATF